MNKENRMYDYLSNHNYISENKKSNYQQELSIERAECIANKFNSLIEQENTDLKQALNEIKRTIERECDFNGTALYDKWIPGKTILQIIDKVGGNGE